MIWQASKAGYLPSSAAIAVLAHLLVIFGLQFLPERTTSASRLEITLASFRHDTAPEEADFIAQENQLGSGTEEDKKLLTTTDQALFADNIAQKLPRAASQPVPKQAQNAQQQSAKLSPRAISPEKQTATEAALNPSQRPELEQVSKQIASLEARLAQQRQLYARKPKVRRITSLSTRSSADARYQFEWQQRVESIGNANYPAIAVARQLEGDVRLLVALLPDGKIKQIELLASSGHKALDMAAIRSVKMAAPFKPLPSAVRKNTDVLEIVRTWQFRGNFLTSS